METLELHNGFHTFTIKYICMYTLTTTNEKSMTELEQENQLALQPVFITHVHYLH